jgi:hypothetical protein
MICYYDPLLLTTKTRNKCTHKLDIQKTKLKGFLQYLKEEHKAKKGYKIPDAKKWELKSMVVSDVPQHKMCLIVEYLFACSVITS